MQSLIPSRTQRPRPYIYSEDDIQRIVQSSRRCAERSVADCVRARLLAYSRERDRLLRSPSDAFFVADHGARLTDCGARHNFAAVCQSIGLRPLQKYNKHGRGPRIHDLRHTFAVRTLLSWYRNNTNPSQEMIKLSTYLGHADPANTYMPMMMMATSIPAYWSQKTME